MKCIGHDAAQRALIEEDESDESLRSFEDLSIDKSLDGKQLDLSNFVVPEESEPFSEKGSSFSEEGGVGERWKINSGSTKDSTPTKLNVCLDCTESENRTERSLRAFNQRSTEKAVGMALEFSTTKAFAQLVQCSVL